MKIFIFLISLIIYLEVSSKKENLENLKKNKKKYIFEHYFKSKIKIKEKKKSERKNKNLIIKGDCDDISYDFDYWERIEYKNLIKTKNEKKNQNINKQKIKYDNNEYINHIIHESNVINENYKINNLLTKFNNRKFIDEEPIPNLKTENLPDKNDNNKYSELIQKNRMNQNNNNNQNINNFNNRDTINNLNNINNYNYMNHMNNRHNPRGFPHSFNSEQFGQSTYFDSQSTHRSGSEHSNYQTYSTTSHKSKMGGYMSNFYQIIMAVGFFGLIYRLLFGNRQNDKFAMGWYDANIDYFKERYELIGLIEDDLTGTYKKPEVNLNTKSLMVKESTHNYQLICGNYRYIKYILINLHFMKKYDMNFFLTSFFNPIRDKITYQVSFNSVDPFGWCFCIARTRQCRGIKQGYEDLNSFCEVYHPHFMDEEICLISEDEEIIKNMFNDKKLLDYYRRIEHFIDNIYYSDTINSYMDENNIYFTFDIDLNESYQERMYLEITHFVNLFVDSLAQIKFTDEFKKNVKNKREKYKENRIRENMKEEIEAQEKKEFIEQFKIKNQMKGKNRIERKKLEKKLKKKNHK
jgi:hypothetical protein